MLVLMNNEPDYPVSACIAVTSNSIHCGSPSKESYKKVVKDTKQVGEN